MPERGPEPTEPRPAWFPSGEKAATELLRRAVPGIRKAIGGAEDPSVTAIAKKTRSPFRILVSTVISARTKDEVTGSASERLFSTADSPADMARLSENEIARLIYPAGFYKTKARAIRSLSRRLIDDFGGEVPSSIEELLVLPGVGRKTANLVVTLAFGNPGICVDTHVHRIVNRLGAVTTKNPKETEFALRRVLPREHWIEINDLLVMYGKEVCTPVSPRCSICALPRLCRRVGVVRSR
jgi:endonuclease-3